MFEASSPAKAILFGEHAVVYGEPAVALSLDRRLTVLVGEAEATTIDGELPDARKHRYARWAVEHFWGGPPLKITTRSSIPSASGLGSSAALSCSVVGALLAMKGLFNDEEVARKAFEVEFNVQGIASPTDTSCSTHGRGIMVSPTIGPGHLWSVSKEERTWHIHHVDIPDLTLVVGYTRMPSSTKVQVQKVRSFQKRNKAFAKELIEEIGNVTREGLEALKKGDRVEIGRLMAKDQSLLSILGVSSKELNKLIDAVTPYSFGAKLTGAGGGGSMIALTEDPDRVREAISKRGGIPYIFKPSLEGTRVKAI